MAGVDIPTLNPGGAGRTRRRSLRRGLAVLAAGSLMAGPLPAVPQVSPQPSTQNLPRLGDAAADELSPATERRIGEAIMRDFNRERVVLDDVEVTEYVNRLATALTDTPAASGYSFEFFLIKESQINAFAMPGGFIGVHTGLIVASQTESELASVLAHEMGHVTQRHIARQLAKQRQTSVLSMASLVLAALAARSNPQAAMGAVAMAGGAQQSIMLGFSRDAEREADRVGIETLRDAGFDPNGMVAFFGRLQQASRVYESNAPSYLRTHPLTSERMADLQARIHESRYKQRADSVEFQLSRAKLRALTDITVDGLKVARTQLERQLRDKTTGDERAAWYGISIAALAQRDFPAAERALGEARKRLPAGHPFFERLAADIKLQSGDPRGAAAIALAGTQRFPESRALVHMRAQALIDSKDFAASVSYLQEQLDIYRADPTLWRLTALAQGAQGRTAEAHRASAEEYALLGGWLAAIEQLRLAQRAGTLDFYTASRVDSRLKELQAQYSLDQQDRKDH